MAIKIKQATFLIHNYYLSQEESQKRKDEMKDREMNRRKMEKLSVLEEEAKNKSEYLQRKADEAKLEDDDQVKMINTVSCI